MSTSSERKIASNRANASHSTGPRTPAGKAKTRMNALKHGLRAEQVVIPGEDPKAFEAECAAWNQRFLQKSGLILAMIEADDGRREPGLTSVLLRVLYESVILPLGVRMYRQATHRLNKQLTSALTGSANGNKRAPARRKPAAMIAVGLFVGLVAALFLLAQEDSAV